MKSSQPTHKQRLEHNQEGIGAKVDLFHSEASQQNANSTQFMP
jgi:hypothetical protein